MLHHYLIICWDWQVSAINTVWTKYLNIGTHHHDMGMVAEEKGMVIQEEKESE